MDDSKKRMLEGLVIPGSVFVIALSLGWLCHIMVRFGVMSGESGSVVDIISILPYLLFVGGVFLGWKYNNTGLLLTAFFLMVVYLFYMTYGPPVYSKRTYVSAATKASLFIFPVNIILFSLLTKRRIFTTTGSLYLFLFAIQFIFIALLFNPGGGFFKAFYGVVRSYSYGAAKGIYYVSKKLTLFMNGVSLLPCMLVFMWTLVFFLARYFYKRDIGLAGFTGVFATAMSGMVFAGTTPVLIVYFTAAGITLIAAIIDSSFTMSSDDTLTGLPARKGLAEMLGRLKGEYVIAMVDIDNFNRFNDSFGPDAGDDVLKTIGDKLADAANGVRAYRYGGEEFLAVFPGMGVAETLKHMEGYRKKIEVFPFIIKNRDWSGRIMGDKKKTPENVASQAHITVSIGVASSGGKLCRPADVVKAADKALFYAKQHGKNCVVHLGGNV